MELGYDPCGIHRQHLQIKRHAVEEGDIPSCVLPSKGMEGKTPADMPSHLLTDSYTCRCLNRWAGDMGPPCSTHTHQDWPPELGMAHSLLESSALGARWTMEQKTRRKKPTMVPSTAARVSYKVQSFCYLLIP